MKRPRIGVVGVGAMGRNHCKVLNRLNHIDFVGVFDINHEQCSLTSSEFQVTPFLSYSDMLSAVDAVIIAAPTAFHFRYTYEALVNAKHVFVEKPFVNTILEAEQLIELYNQSRKTKAFIQVGHIERFNPAIEKLSKIIDPANIVSLEASRVGKSSRSLDIDVVLDLMIHDIDVILSLMNAPLHSVAAVGYKPSKKNLDIVSALLTFNNGAIACLNASRASHRSKRTLSIAELERSFYIDYSSRELFIYRDAASQKIKVNPSDPLQAEIQHFIHSICNEQPPHIGPYEATKALMVAMTIKKAIQQETTIYLEDQNLSASKLI